MNDIHGINMAMWVIGSGVWAGVLHSIFRRRD